MRSKSISAKDQKSISRKFMNSIDKKLPLSKQRNTARSRKSVCNSKLSQSILNSDQKSFKILESIKNSNKNILFDQNQIKKYEFNNSPKINKLISCEISNSCFKIPTNQEITQFDPLVSSKDKENYTTTDKLSDKASPRRQICSASNQQY